MAKEKEDKKLPTKTIKEQDEVPLFYSDIMPLLVCNFTFIILVIYSSNAKPFWIHFPSNAFKRKLIIVS